MSEFEKDLNDGKKIATAKSDIQKINDLLNNGCKNQYEFNQKANSLYKEFSQNKDYFPYICRYKTLNCMNGTRPFNELLFHEKSDVLKMVIKSIKHFIMDKCVDKAKEKSNLIN